MKKITIFAIVAFMIAACGYAQGKKAKAEVPCDPPTLDEYKRLIYDAGGTGVYEAEGVDIMLADAVPVSLAAKIIGAAPPAENVKISTWNANWLPCGFPAKPESRNAAKEKEATDFAAGYLAEQKPEIVVMTGILDTSSLNGLNEWKKGVVSQFTHKGTVPAKQIAILSKSPPVDTGAVAFVQRDGIEPPRGFVWGVYDILGQYVAVIGVEMKSSFQSKPKSKQDKDTDLPAGVEESDMNTAKREEAARQLAEFASTLMSKKYYGEKVTGVIIAGDFKDAFLTDGERTKSILEKGGFLRSGIDSGDSIFVRGAFLLKKLPTIKSPHCRYPMLSVDVSVDERALMVGD